MSSKRLWLLCVGICFFGTACHQPSPPGAAPSPGVYPLRPTRYETPAPTADSSAVHDMVLARKGGVVLLSFWTRYMDSPRSDLRDLAALQRRHYASGLRIIACNCDDPAEWNDFTRPLLLSSGANYSCVIVKDTSREALRTWLDPGWSYQMPARFLFDASGQLVNTFVGPRSGIEHVEGAIGFLLGTAARRSPPRDGATGTMPEVGRGIANPPARIAQPSANAESSAVRMTFIDVGRGVASTMANVVSLDRPDSIDAAAEEIARRVTSPLSRVAVLPSIDALDDPLLERLVRSLRLAGLKSVEPPETSQRWLDEIGISQPDILAEPAVLRDRWDVSYLIAVERH